VYWAKAARGCEGDRGGQKHHEHSHDILPNGNGDSPFFAGIPGCVQRCSTAAPACERGGGMKRVMASLVLGLGCWRSTLARPVCMFLRLRVYRRQPGCPVCWLELGQVLCARARCGVCHGFGWFKPPIHQGVGQDVTGAGGFAATGARIKTATLITASHRPPSPSTGWSARRAFALPGFGNNNETFELGYARSNCITGRRWCCSGTDEV
jgi:hypothetical protein